MFEFGFILKNLLRVCLFDNSQSALVGLVGFAIEYRLAQVPRQLERLLLPLRLLFFDNLLVSLRRLQINIRAIRQCPLIYRPKMANGLLALEIDVDHHAGYGVLLVEFGGVLGRAYLGFCHLRF